MNRLSLDLLWFRGKLDSNLIKFSLTQLHYTIYFLTHFFYLYYTSLILQGLKNE